jgi:hypothetical protein
MIFKLPPQFGQWSMSISKTRLSSLVPLMRAGAPKRLRVIACGLGCLLYRTGNDFTPQLCVRRQHAMGRRPSNAVDALHAGQANT